MDLLNKILQLDSVYEGDGQQGGFQTNDPKEAIKEAELQTKIQIEQAKIESVNERELARTISEMLKKQMDDDKEMDMAALENLVQLASEQMKEMTNDEER